MMNRVTAVALATAFFVCTAGLTAERGQSIRKTAPGQAKTTEPPAPFAGVSLKIGDEKVPPGGIAQVKLFVTEPRPISTAGGKFALDGFDAIEGVALMSPGGDAMGVGIWRGSVLTMSIVSPSTTFGTEPDYPILTIAGRVSATAPLGVSFPLDIDLASLQFADPSGTIYPVHGGSGELFIGQNVNVEDVLPGSADLPAGAVVSIPGRGFDPTTRVRFKEALLSNVTFVDPRHMLVTTGEPIRMHGRGIKVVNADGKETTYFSYQRVRRQFTSSEPTLRDAVAVFDSLQVTRAAFRVGAGTTGIALQNRGDAPVMAAAELLDSAGTTLATVPIRIGASRSLVADLSEVFGIPYAPSQVVRVCAKGPIQVMGIAVTAPGAAAPIVPRRE